MTRLIIMLRILRCLRIPFNLLNFPVAHTEAEKNPGMHFGVKILKEIALSAWFCMAQK